MIETTAFQNAHLPGGLVIEEIEFLSVPMVGGIGRPATARTIINQGRLRIHLQAGADDTEFSVSLYHEVLETATVWADDPPLEVIQFNEGDFERTVREAYKRLEPASPRTLRLLLKNHGFRKD